MLKLLISLLFLYLFVIAYAYFFSDAMMYHPPKSTYQADNNTIMLTTDDGKKIAAIYLQNPQAKYTILYSHGNAEDLGTLLPLLHEFFRHGYSVFAYDYHGYGLSEGRPSETATYLDIKAAYQFLTKKMKINPKDLIVLGRSLGGGPSLELATHEEIGFLIIESSFVSAFRVMTRVQLFPFDKYQNLRKIKKVVCPILIMHGTKDNVIPLWHGQKLFREASAPKLHYWVNGANHNNLTEIAGQHYWQALQEFLK